MPYSLMSPLLSPQSFLTVMSKHERTIINHVLKKTLWYFDILGASLGWSVRGSKGSMRKHNFHMRTNQSRAHTLSHLLCLALNSPWKKSPRPYSPRAQYQRRSHPYSPKPTTTQTRQSQAVSPALPGVSHRNTIKALPHTPASVFWLWCFPMWPWVHASHF